MISIKSLTNFAIVNSSLMSLALIEYYVFENVFNIFLLFLFFAIRNIFLFITIYSCLYSKDYIVKQDRENQHYNLYALIFLFITSVIIETLVQLTMLQYYDFTDTDIINDIMYFIPISFLYEIIFDFFHYWTHRLEHNGSIYKYTHKMHHAYQYTLIQFTYSHHPLDILITNVIPHFLTLFIVPNISKFTYSALLTYKIFIEICGHTGKQSNSSSFPQCIWLPRLLNIELTTKCHDNHHIYSTCNYSKRFSIWDKIFGTYKK